MENDLNVRLGLSQARLAIPELTQFVAALHKITEQQMTIAHWVLYGDACHTRSTAMVTTSNRYITVNERAAA